MAEAVAAWAADAIYAAFEYSAAVEVAADVAYAAVYVAVTAAISYGISEATRPDSQKQQGSELNLVIDADYPRQMIIGKRAIAGSLSAHYANKPSNYNLHLVYAIADHPCTSLEMVYGNGRVVQSSPLTHGVRTEITAYSYSGGARVWMTWHDGRPGQAADANLVTASSTDQDVVAGKKPAWTSNHKGAGVAYVHVELQWDSDILTTVPEFLFLVKGAPLYDRRKDTTAGGSGSHRLDDPSTWEYSENARVALDHYLLGYQVESEPIAFGIGLAPDEIPYDDFAAAADLADEVVTTGVGGDAQDLPRYASNGILGADEDFETIIEAMQIQMAARVVDLGGRIGILGAEERTTIVDLTDQDQIADETFEFDDKLAFDDLIGAVEGRYAEPAQMWQPTDFPRQVGPWAVFADGGEAQTKTFEFRFETNVRRATRNASTILARESLQPRIIGRFSKKAWKLEAGDWFRYSSPHEQLDLAVFEVIEIVKYADFTVALTARAIDPNFVAFDNDNDPDLSVPPDFDPVNLLLDAPSGTLANASITGGGATEPALKFTLADIDGLARELVLEIRKWDSGTSAFVGDPITITAHSDQTVTLIRQGILPNSDYKARAKCRAGRRESPWTAYSSAVTTSTTYTVPGSGVAASIVGQGALATLNTVAANVLAAGVGKNCIIDGDFRFGTTFWRGNAGVGSVVNSQLTANNLRYFQIAGTGVTVGGTGWIQQDSYAQYTSFPCAPGDRIEASAYVGGSNLSNIDLVIGFYDSAGSFVSSGAATSLTSIPSGAGDLSAYTRMGSFATVPVGASRAIFWVRGTASTTSPTLRVTKPYLGKATSAQTEFTPWNIGFEAVPGSDITAANTAAAIAGQDWGATASQANADNRLVPAYGVNLLRTTILASTAGWEVAFNNTGFTGTLVRATDGTTGEPYMQLQVIGTPTVGKLLYIGAKAPGNVAPAIGGLRYEISADAWFTAGSGSSATLIINWHNAAGSIFAQTNAQTTTTGGTWQRLGAFDTAPSNAVGCSIYVITTCGGSAVNPAILMRRPYIGLARATQVTLSDYSAGSESDKGSDVTASNTAAAISGQGVFATGSYYEQSSDPGSVANGSMWFKTTTNELYIRRSGAWGKVATIGDLGIKISVSPNPANGSRLSSGAITTNVAATVTGGSGSYTYQWQISDHTGNKTTSLSNATVATCTLGTTVSVSGDESGGKLTLFVRDSNGLTATFILNYDHVFP